MGVCKTNFDHTLAHSQRTRSPYRSFVGVAIALSLLLLALDSKVYASEGSQPASNGSPQHSPTSGFVTFSQAQRLSNSSISFTGNAELDFGSSSLVVVDDGNHGSPDPLDGCYETTDVPCLPLRRSGFDIRRLYFNYQADTDVMHVGVDCYGICGDTDGDHDPDSASTAWKLVIGKDTPSLTSPEFFHLAIDTSSSGQRPTNRSFPVSIVIGTNTNGTGGYSTFGAYIPSSNLTLVSGSVVEVVSQLHEAQFHQPPAGNLASPIVTGLVDPAARLAEGKNASYGDLEFSIERFSTIPGLVWRPNATFSFRVVAFFGSLSATPYPTVDAVPGLINSALGDNGAAVVSVECPYSLDPFGTCCSFDVRDLCGVCHGNLSNLDPCGVCRVNASLIPTSSCPAAASTQYTMIRDVGTNVPLGLTSNASMALVDINNDLVLDIVIGLPDLNIVVIKFLDANGNITSDVTITNPSVNATSEDQFGYSVVTVGDINYDNVPDLVVGAPGANTDGVVWVFLMSSNGSPRAYNMISPSDIESAYATPAADCQPPAPSSAPSTPSSAPSTPAPSPSTPNSSPANSTPAPVSGEPETAPEAPVTCVPSPLSNSTVPGIRFGSTLLWLGSSFLLTGAPGAAPPEPEDGESEASDFAQIGAFLFTSLTANGDTVGSYPLKTPITNSLATGAGIDPTQVISAHIGQDAEVAATSSSQFTLTATISWSMQNNTLRSSLIFFKVHADGAVLSITTTPIPSVPIPLPEYPDAPAFNSTIMPPNLLPYRNNYTFSLVGAGDLNRDGFADVILAIPTPDPDRPFMIMACILGSNGYIEQTQLIGENGVGHSPISLPAGYQFSMLSSLLWTNSIVAGMTPYPESPVFVVAAVSVDAPVSFYALTLWGSRTSTAVPGTPTASSPTATPISPSTSAPFSTPPISVVPPSPSYPLTPTAATDPIAVQFPDNTPNMRISSQVNYFVWTQFQFARIVERSANSAEPLNTLYFPNRGWTVQYSTDGTVTTFSSFLLNSKGWATNVQVQILVYTPSTESTIVFTPSAYVGTRPNSVKYSIFIRGWTFVQARTVLDIVTTVLFNEPIISVKSEASLTDQTSRFTLQTPSSRTIMSVPTFAIVDGDYTRVPAPSFNQSTGQLIITVPPFRYSMYYDPDIGIIATAQPSSDIDGPPDGRRGKSLLYIIIPSAIGIIIVGVLIVILATCLCQQRRAEQRWKDAGAV